MQILDTHNRLDTYLRQYHGKTITLISAFASETNDLLGDLLTQDNSVTLIIGSINAFTPPTFITACKEKAFANRSFSFFVDFRYENSTHWKVYLIEPDVVVIGSANLTATGTRLARDTCIVVHDRTLYMHYLAQATAMLNTPGVVSSTSKAFDRQLTEYEARHRRVQGALQRSQSYTGVDEWLADDTNQTLPIFVWSEPHAAAAKGTARQAHENVSAQNHWDEVKDFFAFESEGKPCPYTEGSMVLTVRGTGAHPQFHTFDRILEQEGVYYCYAFKKKKYPKPFDIKALADGLKSLASGWVYKTTIGRDEIRQLIAKSADF